MGIQFGLDPFIPFDPSHSFALLLSLPLSLLHPVRCCSISGLVIIVVNKNWEMRYESHSISYNISFVATEKELNATDSPILNGPMQPHCVCLSACLVLFRIGAKNTRPPK